jgi:hypothetical protein
MGRNKTVRGGRVKSNLCPHENFMLQKQSSRDDDTAGNVLPSGCLFFTSRQAVRL